MIRFLVLVFGVYFGMHLYFYWKVQGVLRPPWLRLTLVGVLLLMAAGPFLGRLLDRAGWLNLGAVVSVAAYLWMAMLFWFIVLNLLGDLWNLGVWAAGRYSPAVRRVQLRDAHRLIASGLLIAAGTGWGLWSMMQIRVRRLTIDVPALPAGRQSVTLAQVSDLHLGLHTGRYRLGRVVALLRQERPDIIVSTGDLVDSSFENINAFAPALAELQPPLGKYAVLGNHEYYAGLDDSLAFHRDAGFRLLRAEYAEPAPALRLAGVDDPAGLRSGQPCLLDEQAALGEPSDARATVLLKHRPSVLDESIGKFHLQLSGHTHGGQIFPFHVAVALNNQYFQGLYELGGGSRLYVSRGTGTWGPPLRVLAPPEITLITLRLRE